PRSRADGHVLVDDPRILDGHVPPAKLDHARPQRAVPRIEGRFLQGVQPSKRTMRTAEFQILASIFVVGFGRSPGGFMLVGAAVVHILLFAAAPQWPAAPPPAGSGLILGRVVDAGTGRPVSDAIVSISGGAIGTPRAVTSASGQFVFRKLPKGRFSL